MNFATNNTQLSSSKPYLVRALLGWIVDNDLTPYLLVDSELPGVRVPRQYVKDGQIVLNISPQATSHFEMTNSKLQFRAGFGGSMFDVLLPTRAILAIYARENGQGMSFSSDIPGGDADDGGDDGGEELVFSEKSTVDSVEAKEEKPKAKPSHLKIIK